MTMYRSDLDSRPLLMAIQRLSYLPWHLLAGRPDPGLLMDKNAPPVAQWSGRYDGLADRYESIRQSLQGEAAGLLPAALRSLLDGSTSSGAAGREEKPSEDGESTSSPPDAASSEQSPAFLRALEAQHPVSNALRHAWATSRMETKVLVEGLAQLRLSSAAINEARQQRDGATTGASSEVEAAAVHTVLVARLMNGASSYALVANMFTVMKTMGKKLPEVSRTWGGRG